MADTYPADTLLAVDFGTATTRVSLFDVVEGTYRFVASGEAPSTVEPPFLDASEGMRHALAQLQAITGRAMLDESARLIMPATPDGNGADAFVATASAGPAVRALLVGLLPDVSVTSARRTAASSYISVVDAFSLGDRRREDQRIDALLAAKPELVLIAGGTDGGASDAVLKLTETVGLACQLLPPKTEVRVLYTGNAALADKINGLLGQLAVVHVAPNVQPELSQEVLAPARAALAKIFEELRLAQIGGFTEIAQWAGGRILPTAQAEGQIIRFLSRLPGATRGALGVDVGSASTSIAAAFGGELFLNVRPDLGVGVSTAALADAPPDQFTRWVPFEISGGDVAVREFILTKSAHPHTVPADVNDLYLEHALARQVIRSALRAARPDWPPAWSPRPDLLPAFDRILGGGAVLGRAPRPGAAALILLDALQPTGLTTLMLDVDHLAAALGAAAYVTPVVVPQALESGAFLTLGPAVSVVGRARPGAVVCRAKLVYPTGADMTLDVRFGSLEVLPLPLGQSGKLTLKPRSGMDVGFGPGRGRTITVTGGAVGVILDARGRPIVFPSAAKQRFETMQQWIWKIGGV